jgi:CheY-like chemotaxis protein/HPt (histidine-containing phosphotransfer) domain-containing protein
VDAIKFTERGKVTIRLQVDAECLKVVIEDTGIGISEKDQARLFKAFSQIDGSSVRNQGGTGLGLAISQRLVGALGGRLGLESTPGAGSRFWFTLPLEGATHEAPKNKLPGQRVMIVSDSEDVCESIREYLERWDMQGLPEASGLEALDRMQQLAQQGQAVSAVILSASSADLGAAEFIELLGQAATIKDVPVLLLRDPGAEHVPARLSACVFAELARPFRASDLYDALTRTFGAVSRADPRRSAPSPPNAARLKVLIVDDNEVNRFVAVQQVERLGYAAETACNGQEAVAKVVDGDFSAVLMDCQMPVMDGYEATREIRRREGGSRYTPIIALTAHALARERDKCTAAGMDGYLTKPARADTLRAALERWTAARRSGQSGPMRAPSPPPETLREPPPSDPTSTPEEIARAPVLADEERPARLVELFLDRTPPLIEELRRAIERADTGELRARAHKLKGSCLAVGAERMALLAAQLQHAGEHGDARAAERGLAPLLEQWSSVRERLEREQRSALAGASAQSDGG